MPELGLPDGVAGRVLYSGLVILVAAVRLVELARARRNTRRLLAAGGREVGRGHYPVMVALHVALLAGAPLEVWLLARPLLPPLAALGLGVLAGTMALRWWVMATLGERWTTRIVVLPGAARVTAGPFRFLRHPNYLAVAFEVPAIALVHTAWLTALVVGGANLALLRHRIRTEDDALAAAGGSG